jgi:hypothetical protein
MGSLRMGSSNVSRSLSRAAQILEEDEYIGDLVSPASGYAGFSNTQYPINIGQAATFPWANKAAALFERYLFEYLEFYYRREVSEFATAGSTGKIVLSMDPNASNAPPSTKQAAEDFIVRVDGMPCTDVIRLAIPQQELKRLNDGFFVRTGTQPANTDIKTYDIGNLNVSTYGIASASAALGELRVRYRVRLFEPNLVTAGGQAGQPGSQLVVYSGTAGETAAATTVYQTAFATATTPIVAANAINATIASTGLITLQAGTYLVQAACQSNCSSSHATTCAIELCTSATANTGVVVAGSAIGVAGSTTANNPGGSTGGAANGSFIWPTAQWGTTLALQSQSTYGGGVATAYLTLSITQL